MNNDVENEQLYASRLSPEQIIREELQLREQRNELTEE